MDGHIHPKIFPVEKFPMHVWKHSARLSRFTIISLEHKPAASGIVVLFTKSDEKEIHGLTCSSATYTAIMCSYKDRWAAAVGELLMCSRERTNPSMYRLLKFEGRKMIVME